MEKVREAYDAIDLALQRHAVVVPGQDEKIVLVVTTEEAWEMLGKIIGEADE